MVGGANGQRVQVHFSYRELNNRSNHIANRLRVKECKTRGNYWHNGGTYPGDGGGNYWNIESRRCISSHGTGITRGSDKLYWMTVTPVYC